VRGITYLILMLISFQLFAIDTGVTKQLDQVIEDLRVRNNIPAMSIAVVDKGDIIYMKGFGLSNGKNLIPTTENTLFRIASISKLFTAQAVIQLVEKKKVGLDEKIGKYLTQFQSSRVTIRQLLTHQAGLLDKLKPVKLDTPRSVNEYLSAVEEVEGDFSGEDFKYSDTGFNILGAIVSSTSGRKFEDYIQEHILAPTNMSKSGYYDGRTGVKPDVLPTHKSKLLATKDQRPYDIAYYPSEGLVSNVRDLAIWVSLTLEMNNIILSQESYRLMLVPQVKTSWGNIKMGLGWQVYKNDDGREVARHPGSVRGYKTLLLTYPQEKRAIIILSNSSTTPRLNIANEIEETLKWKQ